MLLHHCTACSKRQLIFPSQVTAVTGSDEGPVVTFTCWCGEEQSAPLGWTSAPVRREPQPLAA